MHMNALINEIQNADAERAATAWKAYYAILHAIEPTAGDAERLRDAMAALSITVEQAQRHGGIVQRWRELESKVAEMPATRSQLIAAREAAVTAKELHRREQIRIDADLRAAQVAAMAANDRFEVLEAAAEELDQLGRDWEYLLSPVPSPFTPTGRADMSNRLAEATMSRSRLKAREAAELNAVKTTPDPNLGGELAATDRVIQTIEFQLSAAGARDASE
jgi:hypothetical protein